MTPEEIAEVCCEANRTYCQLMGDPVPSIWSESSMHTQDSTTDGVIHAQATPKLTPEESHARWTAWRRHNGWTLGPEKDEEAKTHPNLVPWSELPEVQKAKDELFLGIVRALSG